MRALAVARVELKRFFRDRQAIFVVFVLPIMIVLLLGASSGGAATPKVGFNAAEPDDLTAELASELNESSGIELTEYDSPDDAIRAVERGALQAAITVPAGYEATLRSGGTVEIGLVARAEEQQTGIREVIGAAITRQATLLRAARFATDQGIAGFDDALDMAQVLQGELPDVEVTAEAAGEEFALTGLGQFDISAQTMLVLFMFMTTISGASQLVQARSFGVAKRMYSTPTTIRSIIAGEGLGRFAIALIQGSFILIGTWIVFGVDWGDPVGVVATIIVFAAVSSAAAMLLGALVDNERQAGGLATALGLGLAALGGCMFPLAALEILSETVYKVAHVTPHAWALESFLEMVAYDGGLGDIAGYLLVLVGFGLVFLALAVWRLRVVLTR